MKQLPATYREIPEVVLGNVDAFEVPEIKVSFNRSTNTWLLGQIRNSFEATEFLRKIFKVDEIELQEHFVVLYLNSHRDVIGYYKYAKGGIDSVIADVRLIMSVALKCTAVAIIVCHNHPSGGLIPSTSDKILTKKLREAGRYMDIELSDHIILTKDAYFSFADEGREELHGTPLKVLSEEQYDFINKIKLMLTIGEKHDKRRVEKLAAEYGIFDKTDVKELTELAIVAQARILLREKEPIEKQFKKIVSLYNSQVNLSHRTSQSILLQQYSTPAPIGFLAGIFCGVDKHGSYFEPSAGNGLLTIVADPKDFTVNEIDKVRNRNLEAQGFSDVLRLDASKPFGDFQKQFDAVITNPPFGRLGKQVTVDGYPISVLDHLMVIYALDTMKDKGKAAFIIGGHTDYDAKGRVQAGSQRLFFNYLYSHYNVIDVIPIDGSKLYSRQGTSFNVRLILIDGRKKIIEGFAPVYDKERDTKVQDYQDLFKRVMDNMKYGKKEKPEDDKIPVIPRDGKMKPKWSHIQKAYATFWNAHMQVKPGSLILVEEDGYFYAFGHAAIMISSYTNVPILEINIVGESSYYLMIPAEDLDMYLDRLSRKGEEVYLKRTTKSFRASMEEEMAEIEKELEKELKKIENGEDEMGSADEKEDDNIIDHAKLFKRWNELKPAFNNEILLIETPSMFISFNEDAILLAKTLKIGTVGYAGDGHKFKMAGISKLQMDIFLPKLIEAGLDYTIIPDGKKTDWKKLANETEQFVKYGNGNFSDLGAPYTPASESCVVLNTVVPDSMEYETTKALEFIQGEVGGNIDEFVRQRLGYNTKIELCKALSAEQTDAVAMAIYNIEAREQGMIIGDQTGIGKGRVAAAMIRYSVLQGHKPVFITEKPNLFSDIYRDLIAIGSGHLVPFIVNGKESKTDIKDENGEILYQASAPAEQQGYFKDKRIPGFADFVLATYSQFNSPDKKPEKPSFLNAIAEENILILDESHNASGSSQVGEYLQGVLSRSKGVIFLSATFAKRPDNMPIYAMKTAIRDANMTKEELVAAINKGGVALQEVLASQLVKEGQMLRRERSFEGVEVNYISLDELATEHKAIADNITEIVREIIAFQGTNVDKMVDELDDIAVAEGKEVKLREGTSQAGVDNQPYFSKVFQVINQMLFAIKAEAVADRAIERLKEGKKPVIAFSSTMGSFIEQMESESGLPVADGDTVNADFSEVLMRGLDGVLRYTVTSPEGKKEFRKFDLTELPKAARAEYLSIAEKIKKMASGISISPIDIIVQKLKAAGYRVAEVTGRKYEVQINTKTNKGIVLSRNKINTNDAFRQFNNNEVDVLLINQSGSTGASAHAIVTKTVQASEVKQRVMIVLQAELDINTEVQKRGRINRTGQILTPIYDYVMSAIPAEKRLMMMLQKKLKSLDANTTSNQKQSTKILDVPDFLNKYGDKVVTQYLQENKEINKLLGDPLHLEDTTNEKGEILEDAAHKVSGRVAVLSTQMQADFYNEIAVSYNEYVEYLRQIGEYDLEVEAMNLEAETISEKIVRMGKGGDSEFGTDSILERIEANVLRKPFSKTELKNILDKEMTENGDVEKQKAGILKEYNAFSEKLLETELNETEQYYEKLIKEIPKEKKALKIQAENGETALRQFIKERENELGIARAKQLEKVRTNIGNRQQYLSSIFKFFFVGKNLLYPVSNYADGDIKTKAVFLGIIIDKKKKNPYAPSNIRLRFALASSNKYIAMPASYTKDINAIMGASYGEPTGDISETLEKWESAIKEANVNRNTRYVVTGNLLQAFSDFHGKLVSYTTKEGGIKKGILMPEYWEQEGEMEDTVTVPVARAEKVITSLVKGNGITTENGTSIFNTGDELKIIVPGSKQKGGEVFLDEDILRLVERNNFEKASDKMVAYLQPKKLPELLRILQDKFNDSVKLEMRQFALIKDTQVKHKSRNPIKILSPEEVQKEMELQWEVEMAQAELELEMEMLHLKIAA